MHTDQASTTSVPATVTTTALGTVVEPSTLLSQAKAATKRARDIQASARTKRKKRAELLQLRALAAALETRRDALRDLGERRRPGGFAQAVASEAAATLAASELHESRVLNRRLRDAVEKQRGIAEGIVQVLKKKIDLKIVQDLLAETRVYGTGIRAAAYVSAERLDVASTAPGVRCPLSQDLHVRLQTFATEASVELADAVDEGIVTQSHTRISRHDAFGPVVEMVASSLVPCGLEDGWAVVLRVLRDAVPPATPRAFGYSVQSRANGMLGVSEKDFSMAFTSGLAVDGLALFEVFGSNDMKLFVWTSVASVREDGTYVRERGWTAMTPAAGGNCVLHSRHELQTTAAPGPKSQLLIDSLLLKARQDQSNLESAMATRFGSDMSWAALVSNDTRSKS